MAARSFQFTSESVTEGHPDKIADQVSDAVLDAVLADDPSGRVACETLITTGLVVVAGEITTETYVDIPRLVRKTISEIGYTRAKYGFDAETCGVIVAIDEQSADIALGIDDSFEAQHGDSDPLDRVGAGDQGMMFGYASRETDELMPLPIMLAHRICKRLSEVRKADVLPYLRPDGKAQVTVRYDVDEHGHQRPVEIERILISTQHRDGLDAETLIKPDLIEHVIHPILPHSLYNEQRLEEKDFVYVNPTGKFVIGGPMGDTGLTGRKIIVDTYGGAAPHGGGAFSGKDPTKVDRSAAYAARYVAKNVVAAGLADRCQIQVAYAIGVAHPLSVLVDCFGTEAAGLTQEKIERDHPRAVRPSSGRDPARPRPAPADLREDGRVRPLRPRGPRLHVGADGQGGRTARGRWPCDTRDRLEGTSSPRRRSTGAARGGLADDFRRRPRSEHQTHREEDEWRRTQRGWMCDSRPSCRRVRPRGLDLCRLAGVSRVLRHSRTGEGARFDRRTSVPDLVHGNGRRHTQAPTQCPDTACHWEGSRRDGDGAAGRAARPLARPRESSSERRLRSRGEPLESHQCVRPPTNPAVDVDARLTGAGQSSRLRNLPRAPKPAVAPKLQPRALPAAVWRSRRGVEARIRRRKSARRHAGVRGRCPVRPRHRLRGKS